MRTAGTTVMTAVPEETLRTVRTLSVFTPYPFRSLLR